MSKNLSAPLKKPGRNDPCPCGSGKKYKKCCGGADSETPSHTNFLSDAFEKINTGDIGGAEKLLQAIIKTSGKSAETVYLSAFIAHQKGNLSLALSRMQKAAELIPDEPEVFSNLSRMLYESGIIEESERAARKSIHLDSNYADAHNNLGNALKDLGRIGEAVKCYIRAVKLEPGNPWLWVNLGSSQQAHGESSEALSSFQTALNLDINNATAHIKIASIYLDRHDHEKALDHLERAKKLTGLTEDIAINFGNVYLQLGAYSQAERWYKDALAINPSSAGAFINLANVNADLGMHERAQKYYKKAIDLDSTNTQALRGAASVEEERHHLENAETLALEALNLAGPDLVKSQLLLAKIYRRQKRYEETENLLELAKDDAKSNDSIAPVYYIEKARMFERTQQYEEAFKSICSAKSCRKIMRNTRYDPEFVNAKFSMLREVFAKKSRNPVQHKSQHRCQFTAANFYCGFSKIWHYAYRANVI